MNINRGFMNWKAVLLGQELSIYHYKFIIRFTPAPALNQTLIHYSDAWSITNLLVSDICMAYCMASLDYDVCQAFQKVIPWCALYNLLLSLRLFPAGSLRKRTAHTDLCPSTVMCRWACRPMLFIVIRYYC